MPGKSKTIRRINEGESIRSRDGGASRNKHTSVSGDATKFSIDKHATNRQTLFPLLGFKGGRVSSLFLLKENSRAEERNAQEEGGHENKK